jgi:glycosyltransferase involved in cell wall biosynthesis
MPLLTILIPTRNRARDLQRCLELIADAVDTASCAQDVEVVCADNCSKDETRAIVTAAIARMPYLRYERQREERQSAEASYFNSFDFCRGEFVWSFGDDDEMDAAALVHLIPVLGKADFYLINMRILSEGKHHHYILTSAANIQYQTTADLFKDLGLVSATTTLSCLCVRRTHMRQDVWARYLGLSLIYSHSCALLALFHQKPAIFVGSRSSPTK